MMDNESMVILNSYIKTKKYCLIHYIKLLISDLKKIIDLEDLLISKQMPIIIF